MMFEKYLNRDGVPFGSSAWEAIDAAVVGAARSQLTGRKVLHVEGTFGLGLKAIPRNDAPVEQKGAGDVAVMSSAVLPLAMLQGGFSLGMRDLAAFEQSGLPLDVAAPAEAAIAVARQEDALIFGGSKPLGMQGLLNAAGSHKMELKNWDKVGTAADDVIQAVTRLDDAGFHGPYTLALNQRLHNLLLRCYPQGVLTELEHVRQIVGDAVVKSAAIAEGGVLIASGKQYASIILGQDLVTGLVGPEGAGYRFIVFESLAVRIIRPDAIVVLK